MSRAKPPGNSLAGGSQDKSPPRIPAEPEPEESRRHALLSMLEDLEEDQLKIEQASREWVATFDAILDPVFLHDADYRIVRANRAYAKCAGMPVQKVIGKPYWQVYPKISGPLATCLHAIQKAEEEEEEVNLATGETLRSRAFTVRDASGDYLYSVHVLEDVTEKRRTEAECHLLSEALRQAAAGLVVVDTDLSIRYANPASTTLLGYETGQLDGRPLLSIIPNDLHEQVPILQALLDAGSQWTGEFFLVANDGARIPIHLALSSTTDAKGKVIAYLGSLLDLRPIKQAQQALVASEAKFRSISVAALDAVLMIDNDGRLLYWNPAAERIFGYSEQEILGRPVHQLLAPPRYHADIERGFAAFRETGTGPIVGKTLEMEALRKDGSKFPIELSISALRLNDRWHAVGILRDITARQHAEEALRESEEKFRELVETTTDWIWRIDEHGVYTYTSPQVRDILGYEPEEILGKTPFDLMSPSEAGRIRQVYESIVASQKPFHLLENVNLHKSGRVVVLETSGAPIFDQAGAYKGCRGIDRDITARKQAEEALRASHNLINTVVESVPIRVFWKDREMRFLGCNTAFARDAGMARPEDLLGKDDFQMSWRDQAGLYRADDKRVMDSDAPKLGFEESQTTPDGRTIWLRTSKVPLHDVNGKVFGMLGIYEDITPRKQAEEALRRSDRALNALSTTNTALIHATSESGLLDQACRTIVEIDYRFVWIGYLEHDERKSIRPMARAGFELGYLETQHLTWADTEYGRGPSGQAARSGQPAVVRNIVTDPNFAPWREHALKRGYASAVALPLKENNHVFGVLDIFAAEPDAFDEQEVALLTEMTEDLAFGILTLRARVEHERLLQEHLKSAERLKETLSDAIRAIALTVEKRDPYTAGHQNRVADLCAAIGRELGLPEDRIEGLRLGATIHDIGKIYVPAEILNRPGKLSNAEFEIIKSHPEVGYDIVKDVQFPWPVGEMILQHHERLDGSGYPKGLKGEAIILEARILAVADTVEAMSAHRPYRSARGIEPALAEITARRGNQYDADVVDACLKLFSEKRFAFSA